MVPRRNCRDAEQSVGHSAQLANPTPTVNISPMSDEPVLALDLINAACRDGEAGAVTELSVVLSNDIRHRKTKSQRGDSQLVARGEHLPESLTSNFAYRMVQACHREGQALPKDLVELLQLILKQDRPPAKSDRRYIQRLEAIQFVRQNPKAGVRQIAAAVGVAPSTVSRWRAAGKL